MRIWAVIVGLPGYLPNEGWPVWVRTKAEAVEVAKEEKAAFLDYGGRLQTMTGLDAPDIRVTGDIRKDYRYDVLRRHPLTDSQGRAGCWVEWQYISIGPIDVTEQEWEVYKSEYDL